MNKYELDNFIDDIFKECKTIDDMCKRYVYAKNKLEEAFKNNLNFLINHNEKGGADNV